MINSTILQGRLVKDIELRTTNNGVSVANFTVAYNRKLNENSERVLFLDCEAWRGTADLVKKYFKKGNEIIVEGELYTNTYQNENGENRHQIRLLVNQVHFTYGNTKTDDVDKKYEAVNSDNLPF